MSKIKGCNKGMTISRGNMSCINQSDLKDRYDQKNVGSLKLEEHSRICVKQQKQSPNVYKNNPQNDPQLKKVAEIKKRNNPFIPVEDQKNMRSNITDSGFPLVIQCTPKKQLDTKTIRNHTQDTITLSSKTYSNVISNGYHNAKKLYYSNASNQTYKIHDQTIKKSTNGISMSPPHHKFNMMSQFPYMTNNNNGSISDEIIFDEIFHNKRKIMQSAYYEINKRKFKCNRNIYKKWMLVNEKSTTNDRIKGENKPIAVYPWRQKNDTNLQSKLNLEILLDKLYFESYSFLELEDYASIALSISHCSSDICIAFQASYYKYVYTLKNKLCNSLKDVLENKKTCEFKNFKDHSLLFIRIINLLHSQLKIIDSTALEVVKFINYCQRSLGLGNENKLITLQRKNYFKMLFEEEEIKKFLDYLFNFFNKHPFVKEHFKDLAKKLTYLSKIIVTYWNDKDSDADENEATINELNISSGRTKASVNEAVDEYEKNNLKKILMFDHLASDDGYEDNCANLNKKETANNTTDKKMKKKKKKKKNKKSAVETQAQNTNANLMPNQDQEKAQQIHNDQTRIEGSTINDNEHTNIERKRVIMGIERASNENKPDNKEIKRDNNQNERANKENLAQVQDFENMEESEFEEMIKGFQRRLNCQSLHRMKSS